MKIIDKYRVFEKMARIMYEKEFKKKKGGSLARKNESTLSC